MRNAVCTVSDVSVWATGVMFVAGLVVLGVRLHEVQMDGAAKYAYDGSRQAVRRVQTAGPRGRILDRRGRVLADNRATVSVVLNPEFFQRRTWTETAAAISNAIAAAAAVVGRPSPLDERSIGRHIRQSLAMPLTVWREVDEVELARLAEHERELPGFACTESEERRYPEGSLAAHAIGYVGRDATDGAAGDESFKFREKEMRGRAGLEFYYDSYLRGVPGERQLTVDARGFTTDEETVAEPRRGPDLRLALDLDIQRAVERQLQGEKGACAVIDPRDGSVLAFASAPTFDLNEFVPVLRSETFERYDRDPRQPLKNRVSGEQYAPGSTFKPVTALAGLRAGVPADREHECTGVFELGAWRLRCSRRWGHGPLDLRHALRESCNPFFCALGTEIGTNALVVAARDFGLGARTGLDLGADVAGIVPDGEFKRVRWHEPWYPGDLAQMAIGQGMLAVSPLQMALVAGAIGTGSLVTPHFRADAPVERRPLPFAEGDLEVVREGMRLVVDGGTGRLGGEGLAVEVAGKTGTAEIGLGATRRKNTWFIAYAPAENPTVAVAMVIENGESGGGTTAPKVREVLKEVFGEK